MSNEAYKKMMKKIQAKAKEIDEQKEDTRSKTYQEYILDFLAKIDETCITATNEILFSANIKSAADLLLSKLKTVDKDIYVKIMWNNSKNWKELRVTGVTITWSSEYLKLYPDINEQEFVDVTELLFM